MKLAEAIQIQSKADPKARPFPVYVATGFTPLHLATFVGAELQQCLPERKVELQTGLFGDLRGNVARAGEGSFESVFALVEWSDLDARLSWRNSGSWDVETLPDILSTCRESAHALAACIAATARRMPVVVSGPTLPLPPISHERGVHEGLFELQLRAESAAWLARVGNLPGVRIVRAQALDILSPPSARFDAQGELHFGFPYAMSHAAVLAGILIGVVVPVPQKKGIITDLDDTLWKGTLGEDGVEGIGWDLDRGAQIHGAYQRFLNSLASAGVLIGVATRNDARLVQKAFARSDLILRKESVFPVEVGWGAKSASVKRILEAWNIRADDVVFVDNLASELAEVQLAVPGISGMVFPETEQGAVIMMERLRDLFGRERVGEEDKLRANSLKNASAFRSAAASDPDTDDRFLKQAGGEVTLMLADSTDDARALELVNKTNQFNLNGRRFTEKEWSGRWSGRESFVLTVAYKDKYGPLGTIAVVSGQRDPRELNIDVWVMSCRAFSRRIEFEVLKFLFEKTSAAQISFEFVETAKNQVAREFLERIALPKSGHRGCARDEFLRSAPPTYFSVKEVSRGG